MELCLYFTALKYQLFFNTTMVKQLLKGDLYESVNHCFRPTKLKTACVAVLALVAVNNVSAYTISERAHVEFVAQQNLITGKVTDAENKALQGVTVSVLNKNIRTSTDANGRFVINVQKGETLVLSLIGYLEERVVIDSKGNIEITLEKDVRGLEEVTVTGLAGQQKKSTLVGSITSVKPEELKIPTANLSNAIAGKLAGVVAFQRSGEPGADGSTFYIRGISTFSGINSPLIIIDGVPASTGDLNAIAPEAIESFSILKDANATAMYGTKGANGVMIVTTKRGKNLDKARINIRLENAINTPIRVPKFVDGTRFMELYNEAVNARGTGEILYTKDKIEGTRNGLDPLVFPDVNWYAEMFKKNAQGRALNANVQGGGAKVDYFMSATLNMDDGMLRSSDVNSYSNNIKVNRYTFQNNLFAQLTPTTKASLKLNTQLRDYKGPNRSVSDIFSNAINANPVDFPVFFPNNEQFPEGFLFGGKTGGRYNNGFINPYAWMVDGYSSNFQSTVMATLDLTQSLDFLTKGLSANGLMSFKNWSSTTTSRSRGVNNYEILNYSVDADGKYIYSLGRVGSVQSETLGTGTGTEGDRSLYFQAGLNYQRTFDLHDVSGVLVYYQTDYNVNNAGGSLINSLPKRSMSYSGRLSYSYDNRYLFQGTFGYNGSENFAKGSKFGFFPSFGVGYNISNENFFEPLKDKIHHLKLRGSWGLAGNDQIGSERFVYLSDINLTSQSFTTGITQDYTRSGPSYNRFSNPNITWEISEQYNAAIELGLFNSLNFVFDVYKEDRRNIFLSRQTIPDYLGTSGTTIYGNLGRVSAKGIDISADYFKQITSDLSMALKGTFTYAHNVITDYDEPAFAVNKNLNYTGYPINTQLGYLAERLFIDDAEVANSPIQQLGGFVSGGDIKYTDYNNDGLVNSDDRVRMGYPTTPEIVYGFGPSFKFKKFDFSLFFQGAAHTSLFMSGFHPFGTSDQRNVLTFIADDHFSESNPNIYAAYPKLSKLDNPNNTAVSSYYMRDGAFLKLKNAEIGYSYKFARFYCSGLNLATFSKFKYWDPEQGGGAGLSYPTQRTMNIGVQMTFN
ncbi:TonB-dependent receptor [Sphingobacterium sp. SGL-16]|nr:TonB-dependent receptor [Sphingobacterium sp. SGL-16]